MVGVVGLWVVAGCGGDGVTQSDPPADHQPAAVQAAQTVTSSPGSCNAAPFTRLEVADSATVHFVVEEIKGPRKWLRSFSGPKAHAAALEQWLLNRAQGASTSDGTKVKVSVYTGTTLGGAEEMSFSAAGPDAAVDVLKNVISPEPATLGFTDISGPGVSPFLWCACYLPCAPPYLPDYGYACWPSCDFGSLCLKCGTACTSGLQCQAWENLGCSNGVCWGGSCTTFPNGHACRRSEQCSSGHCNLLTLQCVP